jgi:hypothetical protein
MNRSLSPTLWDPEPACDHRLSQRLVAHEDLVLFTQLFVCERRAEIGVSLRDDRKSLGNEARIGSPITRPTALDGDEPGGSLGFKSSDKPAHLSFAEAELNGHLDLGEGPALKPLDGFKATKFGLAHGQELHGSLDRSNRTSLLG